MFFKNMKMNSIYVFKVSHHMLSFKEKKKILIGLDTLLNKVSDTKIILEMYLHCLNQLVYKRWLCGAV